MAIEPITFSCPACGIKLTVPGNLAGVSGPCPTCRTEIQAPHPPPASPPADLQSIEIAEPPASPPPPSPATVDPMPTPTSQPSSEMPERADVAEPVVPPIPEPIHHTEAAESTQLPPPPGKSRLVRILIPLLFLIASVAIGFGVATLIRNRSKEMPGKPPGTRIIIPSESGSPKAPE